MAFNVGDIPIWARLLIALSLAGNAGSGIGLYTKDSSDRYHASTAAKDFEIVSQRDAGLRKDIDRLEARIEYFTKRIQEESREAEDDLKAHVTRSHGR